MDKSSVIETMQDVVHSYREQFIKNDNSTFSNIGNAAKLGYESLKASMAGTDAEKHQIDMFKQYADSFEDALQSGNRMAAQSALDNLEKVIQGFRVSSHDLM